MENIQEYLINNGWTIYHTKDGRLSATYAGGMISLPIEDCVKLQEIKDRNNQTVQVIGD